MYIHSYQIHNVLNEYRKQLSRGPVDMKKIRPGSPAPKDRVHLSDHAQRQLIIDQVSSNIVERIRNANTQMPEDRFIVDRHRASSDREQAQHSKRDTEFSYTFIDEFDRKMINKLPVQNLRPLYGLTKTVKSDMQRVSAGPAALDERSMGVG